MRSRNRMLNEPNSSGQVSLIVAQQDRLLNLRINDQIDQDTFAGKQTQLRDRLPKIKLQLDVLDRSHDETAERRKF
jgi:site-specific DNA recombinase